MLYLVALSGTWRTAVCCKLMFRYASLQLRCTLLCVFFLVCKLVGHGHDMSGICSVHGCRSWRMWCAVPEGRLPDGDLYDTAFEQKSHNCKHQIYEL